MGDPGVGVTYFTTGPVKGTLENRSQFAKTKTDQINTIFKPI